MAVSMGRQAAAVVAVAVVVVAMAQGGEAQLPPCVASLAPCAQFLNSTGMPPQSCCGPLRAAVRNQLVCLCTLFNNPAVLGAINITQAQALAFPKRCGITEGPNICSAPVPAPEPGMGPSRSPAHTPASGATHGATYIRMSGLTGLFLIWWTLVA